MTTSKYEECIKDLSSSDDGKRLKALRLIKNSVIGNKTKKELFIQLGIVQWLVDYLHSPDTPTNYALKVQCATILGSIAYGKDDNVACVVQAGAVEPLLDVFALPQQPDLLDAIRAKRKLLEAAARALKAIFSSAGAYKEDVFLEKHMKNIVVLLDASAAYLTRESQETVSADSLSLGMIAEFLATMIARCCDTEEQQIQLASAGIIQPLINLLHSGYIKAQQAALEALSSLGRENSTLAETIIHSKSIDSNQLTTATMIDFVKSKSASMRLVAATCLTNLYRSGVFSEPFNEIVLVVLPALVKLMKEDTGEVQEQAPLVLADLIKDSDEMQKAAYDADTIPQLAELLIKVSSKPTEKEEPMGIPGAGSLAKRKEVIRENCLIALAAATLLKEDCRSQAIDHKILPQVVSALQSESAKVRLAACQCIKSLSRSVANLRTSLVDAGVATPLIKLLYDESILVQSVACAALCNLTLDFSPMKKNIIDAGAISRFVEFARSPDARLQLNGLWALKSLVFKADLGLKKAVMDAMTFDGLLLLLEDSKPEIQEQSLETTRNLVCGQTEDVVFVIDGFGWENLLNVLETRLQITSGMGVNDEEDPKPTLVEAALYTVVNMCSVAAVEPKEMVMSRTNIVNSVVHLLSHESDSIRLAAAWCVINWTWADADGSDATAASRVQRLRELGVEQKLRTMEKDASLDVRHRVGTALDQFKSVVDV
ncbi:armadillo-type protein [Gongronella butleri]|nr:armadillo-type protein [Gongronella butleri]